jgi:aminoglycoside phosphotransferase (APT) family kinase protein
VKVDAVLVSRLIAAQFPSWADLPIAPVEIDGWDNRTFRLGPDMAVRLPSAERYAAQVAKEQQWLPVLAPFLPLPVPVPLAMGAPADDYPWQWSVYRWLEGETASVSRIDDPIWFAMTLARFLAALQRIDAAGGPPPGPHNFFRGGPLTTYDAETREAADALQDEIDTVSVTAMWDAALAATWHDPAVWIHGDVEATNLLVRDGRLDAVIDFGSCGVGDPSCDLAIAWTFFSGKSRDAFRAALPVDDAAWARGRGWALWKALITLAEHRSRDARKAAKARRTIDEVLGDRRA